MQKITTVAELKESILLLEMKQANDVYLLKEQFKITYESLNPINLIKRKFSELITAPDLKGDILNTTLSLAAGYLSKKVVIGTTSNPLKQLLGTVLQMGVTSIVSKNSDGIKSGVMHLIDLFNKRKTSI